jgi:rfaE bifunctional protein kinase chain/domain
MLNKNRFLSLLNEFSKLDPVLVLGDVGVDKYTYGEVNRISPEAPVPVLEVTKEWKKLGLAANVSDNLKNLGVTSTLFGVIGEDSHATEFENMLEERELKTWGVIRDSSRPTTYKERLVTSVQQICRVDYENKQELGEKTLSLMLDRLNEFSGQHSAIIIEDYAKGLLNKKLLEQVITTFRERNSFIAVDPSRTTPALWYKGVSLLKPNFIESKLLVSNLGYHTDSVEEIAQILVDKLVLEKIVITLGARGMAYIDTLADGKLHVIPTVANEVFDVSGAGDTAISAIVAALCAGATLEEASWIGNCASGVVVGKKGTALVSIAELIAFYDLLHHKKSF